MHMLIEKIKRGSVSALISVFPSYTGITGHYTYLLFLLHQFLLIFIPAAFIEKKKELNSNPSDIQVNVNIEIIGKGKGISRL